MSNRSRGDDQMRILLVDNSKPDSSVFTPLLKKELLRFGSVFSCQTRKDILKAIKKERWDAVVLSGSSLNLSEPLCIAALCKDLMVLFHLPKVPILGICFGMQLMALAYGGNVKRMDTFVSDTRMVKTKTGLQGGILCQEEPFNACFSHGDSVTEVPPHFRALSTHDGFVDVMESLPLLRFGVQFHPERSPHSLTLKKFIDFARKHKEVCFMNEMYTFSTKESLPWASVRYIEQMLRKTNVHCLAEKFSVSRETVEEIWRNFRQSFNIPAVLI